MTATRLREGMHLGQRYKLMRPLGQGSMAEVWAAQDRVSGNQVAVKVISELMALSEQARRRFDREVKVIGSVQHPNVVALLDHGEVDGRPFLVMELVVGQSLEEYLKEHGSIGDLGTAVMTSQILEGLEAIHAIGIVHRDLKPANIFLAALASGKKRVKILDFGVAHILDSADVEGARLTMVGAVLGSPRYMSPEAARATGEIDPRSDLFSVGAVMYHALSGEPPVDGPTLPVILQRIINHEIRPLKELRSDVNPRLLRCVDKAMRQRCKKRYSTAAEMRRDVDRAADQIEAKAGK